jgi:hypothetical protein
MTIPQMLYPAGTRVAIVDREARLTCSLRAGTTGRVVKVTRFGVLVAVGASSFWFAPAELSVAS